MECARGARPSAVIDLDVIENGLPGHMRRGYPVGQRWCRTWGAAFVPCVVFGRYTGLLISTSGENVLNASNCAIAKAYFDTYGTLVFSGQTVTRRLHRPLGCLCLFVSISSTTPSVSLPVC